MLTSRLDLVQDFEANSVSRVDFSCHQHESKFVFLIKDASHIKDELSSISESKQDLIISCESSNLHKLPHELVCSVFTTSSDMKLSTIKKLNDASDDLTPDVILRVESGWHVIEVKTFKGSPETQLLRAKKYEEPLRMRADSNILFDIVLVTDSVVMTGMTLTPRQIDSLCSLYSLGLQFQNEAFKLGWKPEIEGMDLIEMMYREISHSDHLKKFPDDPLILKSADHVECSTDHISEALHSRASIDYEFADSGERRFNASHRLPLFYTVSSDPELTKQMVETINPSDHLSSVWTEAVRLSDVLHWQSADSKPYYSYLVNEGKQPDEDSIKSERFRVKLHLNEEERVFLALRGIQKKELKKNEAVREKYEKSKVPYSITSETSSIDEFMMMDSLFEKGILPSQHEPYCKWIENELEPEMKTLFESVKGTAWFACLSTLHSILAEVNVSRRQNCSKDVFLVKPVVGTGILLLIKPTRADKHIFFSICVPKQYLFNFPCKATAEFHPYGPVVFTDFISTNAAKLSHLLYCNAKMFSVYWCTVMQFGLRMQQTDQQRKMFLLCLLVYLEDKEKTSNDLLTIRYLYMEMCRDEPLKEKIFNRLEKTRRSTLQTWVQQKIKLMIESKEVVRLTKVLDGVKATNIFTGERLTSFEQVLFLSYIGVLHNKDESDEVQGFYKIFNKVIKEELLMSEISKLTGHACTGSFKSHEYCPSLVHSAAKLAKSELHKKGHEMLFKTEIPQMLLSKTWEDFATSKASFDYTGDLQFKPEDRKSHRIKCYEAAHALCVETKTVRPFLSINMLIDSLMNRGGVRANLFKKLQLSGVREIYVLDMLSRVCINYVESISRAICSRLYGETLSNPKSKSKISASHYFRSAKVFGQDFETCISSDDATTWAQKFLMSMFIHMLSEILPVEYHDSVFSILNLVTMKKLQIPNKLIKKLLTEKQSSPELVVLAHDVAYGGTLLNVGESFMSNKSNMMMGILHYTSSLYHWCYLRYIQVAGYSMAKRMKESVLITFKTSSDDSSMLISTSSHQASSPKAILYLKHSLMPAFGMKSSHEKSTYAVTQNIEEFNSKWFVRNTMLSVPLKFVFSATKLNHYLNLSQSVSQLASSRKQLLEEGCGIRMAALVQISHAMMHYLSLSVDISIYAAVYLEKVQNTHPMLGWFPFEPAKICGLFGESGYSAKQPDEYWKWQSLFSSKQMMSSDDEHRIHFELGNSAKHKLMISKISNGSERDLLNENPIELFWKPTSHDFLAARIVMTASNPLVSESFKFLSEAETHAASVYILSKRVWSDYGEKVSLAELYKLRFNLQPFGSLKEVMCPEASMIQELSNVDFGHLVPKVKSRQRLMHITLEKRGKNAICSVMDCVLYKWFSIKVKSRFELEESWRLYQSSYPWLLDTLDATKSLLEADAISVHHLIKSVSERDTRINILSTARDGVSEFDTLMNVIRESQWSDLSYPSGELKQGVMDRNSQWNNLYSLLLLCSSGPNPHHSVHKIISSEFKVMSDEHLLESLTSLTNDEARMLIFCQKLLGGNVTKASLMKAKLGKICYYVDYGLKRIYHIEWPDFNVELSCEKTKASYQVNEIATDSKTNFIVNKREVMDVLRELAVSFSLKNVPGSKLNSRLEYTDSMGVPFIDKRIQERFHLAQIFAEVSQEGKMRLLSKIDGRFITMFLFDPKMKLFKLPVVRTDVGLTPVQLTWCQYKTLPSSLGLALLSKRLEWVKRTLAPKLLLLENSKQGAFERIAKSMQVQERKWTSEDADAYQDMMLLNDFDPDEMTRMFGAEVFVPELGEIAWAEEMSEVLDEDMFEMKTKRSPLDLTHPFWNDTVSLLLPIIRNSALAVTANLRDDLVWLGVIREPDAEEQVMTVEELLGDEDYDK